MPLTAFYCDACDKEFSRFRSLSQISEGASCPHCEKTAPSRQNAAKQTAATPESDDNLPPLT